MSPNHVNAERAEDIASGIDAGAMKAATKAYWAVLDNEPRSGGVEIIAGAIQAAQAKGDHFLSYFERLAREHPAANAALDTARREWAAKTMEGK